MLFAIYIHTHHREVADSMYQCKSHCVAVKLEARGVKKFPTWQYIQYSSLSLTFKSWKIY